ncbi:MAG: SDR family oxidoreductase [Rhodospirillaceae bacterium]|nr:SDR family oxidoreductase [Rhodospirillaceae bacterium]MBL6940913.1 SDR family oxidoreductase [Rhodospirillales bacterium]
MPQPRLFCFGLGYSARALALVLIGEGWQVAGTVREEDNLEELKSLGIEAHLFDRDRPLENPQSLFENVSHVLSSVPPDGQGDVVLDLHSDILAGPFDWIGYLSTTGVYGNRDGGLVNESDALAPTSDRARRRAEAESRWRALGAHAFRLAGIYGPGRNVLEDVRAGRARRIDKPGHVFSRIHVDDIGNVVRASMKRPNPGSIYNVCDDEPAAPMEVVTYACELLGVAPPPVQSFDEAEKKMSAMGRTFWADNKRVDNSRIKNELNARLLYPGYRQGLAAILESIQ